MTRPGAMTVDVEEHYHAAALAAAWPRDGWDGQSSRVVDNTRRLLEVFGAAGARATFFILGSVAERHPELVRAIVRAGHEVASHGQDHFRVGEQTPAVFRADVSRSRKALEDAGGERVDGYRAANFSISGSTWWAYEELRGAGFTYSSSINPIVHDHYGIPGAPRTPFRPLPGGMIEIPVTTARAFGVVLPAGGGGYFRLLPYAGFRWLAGRARGQIARCNFYIHPWEIDPGQPRAPVRGRARFRHYVNLASTERKLARLTREHPWREMRDVYGDALSDPSGLPIWQPPSLRQN